MVPSEWVDRKRTCRHPFRSTALLLILLALFALALFAAGCGGTRTIEAESPDKTIRFGIVSWAEAVAVSNLWKVVLEDEGYEVELIEADGITIAEGLVQGDLDLFVDLWLPYTHGQYVEEYENRVDDLGIWYDSAKIGLVVPNYMEATQIEDLAKYGTELDGRIVGIDAEAGIMRATRHALETYGLQLELLESSEEHMIAELSRAYEAKRPIVVTGWSPHWKFAKYDLKFLEDPKGSFGGVEQIHIVSRLDFAEDHPELAERLRSFTMNDQQLGSLELLIQEGMDPEHAAREWLKDNAGVVPGT